MAFLIAHPPSPKETLGNLLLLYAKHEYFELAADLLAENADIAPNQLGNDLCEYLEAIVF